MKKKLLTICGPTAVGKSRLAVELASRHNGEVISADSRQVYKELDIATGKITEAEMKGVSHHLLDVAAPDEDFSVANFKELADSMVADIQNRDKLPILCGGTGFYIQAVVDDLVLPDVAPNPSLRKKLSERSAESLFAELQEKDPRRAREIDENNPRRLIRALEIVAELGQVPELEKRQRFNTLQIGLDLPDKQLKQRIIVRTKARFEEGIIAEAKSLHQGDLTLERMQELGLEYKHLARYLTGEISKGELFEKIIHDDWQYAKRQRTWFRKDERIIWFNPIQEKEAIAEQVNNFVRG